MRISDGAIRLNIQLLDGALTSGSFDIKDIFTTQDGSWEPDGRPYSVPQWARDSYLTKDFDDAGAAHHLLTRFEDEYGAPIHAYISYQAGSGPVELVETKPSGWANMPMFNSFSPERGEVGPWRAFANEIIHGFNGTGLPNNLHVSTFVVWQRVNTPVPPDDQPNEAYVLGDNVHVFIHKRPARVIVKSDDCENLTIEY